MAFLEALPAVAEEAGGAEAGGGGLLSKIGNLFGGGGGGGGQKPQHDPLPTPQEAGRYTNEMLNPHQFR